jgi:YtxH-like protein
MKLRKEKVLLDLMLGAGVYLLDSLRGRMSEGIDDLRDRARDTYETASDRFGRARQVIRGEDHPVLGAAGALLIGVGIGVGVGMLLAPASGEDTRRNISDKVEDFRGKVRERFNSEKQPASGTYGG